MPASMLILFASIVRRRARLVSVTILTLLMLSARSNAVSVDFEDRSLPSTNSFYNGSDGASGFTSRGAHFSNNFDPTFGSWAGFAYSNVNNSTTPGFANQYAAITGSGLGGAGIYGVSFPVESSRITLPLLAPVLGMYVTNATYAYLAVRDGNDGFGAVRQFGDDPAIAGGGNQGFPDWFKLTITGRDERDAPIGSVDFYLADYRFANNADDYVVNDWRRVDLSGLGAVKSLSFNLTSSDVGTFGVNTPAYFAIENLEYVPEPLALTSVTLIAIGMVLRRMPR
jgi:hypothetical protein